MDSKPTYLFQADGLPLLAVETLVRANVDGHRRQTEEVRQVCKPCLALQRQQAEAQHAEERCVRLWENRFKRIFNMHAKMRFSVFTLYFTSGH